MSSICSRMITLKVLPVDGIPVSACSKVAMTLDVKKFMLNMGTMISTKVVYCRMRRASLYRGFCHVADSKGEHRLGWASSRPYCCMSAKDLLMEALV